MTHDERPLPRELWEEFVRQLRDFRIGERSGCVTLDVHFQSGQVRKGKVSSSPVLSFDGEEKLLTDSRSEV